MTMLTSANNEPYRITENVYLDPNSEHQWDELIQRDFLKDTFHALQEFLDSELQDVKFYVFSPYHADRVPASIAFKEQRKVLIFLSDEADSVTPTVLSPYYIAIFKPSMRVEKAGENIHTMSLGLANGVPEIPGRPMHDRYVDVLFTGNLNRNRYPLYFAFHPILRKIPKFAHSRFFHFIAKSPLGRLLTRDFSDDAHGVRLINFTSGFGKGLSRDAYGKMLADSRIVLAPRGFVSAETFRHLEALRAGAVVVSDRLPDTFLYRNSPIICVDEWGDGLHVVDSLLQDPDRLESLQAAGLRWYNEKLSPRATARWIIEKVSNADA